MLYAHALTEGKDIPDIILAGWVDVAGGAADFLYVQVICAMDYCHRFGIAHRDLSLENTLLVMKGRRPLIKICDFG